MLYILCINFLNGWIGVDIIWNVMKGLHFEDIFKVIVEVIFILAVVTTWHLTTFFPKILKQFIGTPVSCLIKTDTSPWFYRCFNCPFEISLSSCCTVRCALRPLFFCDWINYLIPWKQSASWEAYNFTANQKISRRLWNPCSQQPPTEIGIGSPEKPTRCVAQRVIWPGGGVTISRCETVLHRFFVLGYKRPYALKNEVHNLKQNWYPARQLLCWLNSAHVFTAASHILTDRSVRAKCWRVVR